MGARASVVLAEHKQGMLGSGMPGSGFALQLFLLQLHPKSLGNVRQPCEALDDSLAANNPTYLRLKNRSFGDWGIFDSTATSLKCHRSSHE